MDPHKFTDLDLRINIGNALRTMVSGILTEELHLLERSLTSACDEVLNVYFPGVPGLANAGDSSHGSSRRQSTASVVRRLSTASIYHRDAPKHLHDGKHNACRNAILKQIETKLRGSSIATNGHINLQAPSNREDSETSDSVVTSPNPTQLHIPDTPTEPYDEQRDTLGSDYKSPRTSYDVIDDAHSETGGDTVGDMRNGHSPSKHHAPPQSPSMMSTLSSLLPSSPSMNSAPNGPVPSAGLTKTAEVSTSRRAPLRSNKRLGSLMGKQVDRPSLRKDIERVQNSHSPRNTKVSPGSSHSPGNMKVSPGATFTDIANPESSNSMYSAPVSANGRKTLRSTKRITSLVPNLSDIQSTLAKLSPRLFNDALLSPVESPDGSFVDGCLKPTQDDCIAFEIREDWNIEFPEGDDFDNRSTDGGVGLARARTAFVRTKSEVTGTARDVSTYKPPRYMISPHSPKRLVWDIFSAIFILYDGVTTPLQFFNLEPNLFTTIIQWVIRIFWTLDMPLTCMSGYTRQDGEVEMKPRSVFIKYLKSWLFIDILVVSADWLDELVKAGGFSAGGNAARLSKVMRIVRILRMVRLLRVGRLPQIFERLSDLMPMHINFVIRAAASVLKIMGLILLITHCIACTWYAVGDMGGSENNWVEEHDLIDRSKGYLYLTAFHWSLTQFSGSMEVFPVNTRERLLAVLTLLFSFMASNIFVSSLTSSMTRFQLAASRQTKMFAELRRYLEKHDIAPSLAIKLNRNALFAFKEEQRNIDEDKIELLTLVSEPLRVELHSAIYAPVLNQHEFFASLADCPGNVQTKICHNDVSTRIFLPGDVIFTYGEEPDGPEFFKMLFVSQGKLKYTRPHGTASNGEDGGETVQELEKGAWLCEAVLWVKWMFFGELRATGTCSLVVVGSEEMQNITNSTKMPKIAHYARGFAHCLSKTPLNTMTDIGTSEQVAAAMAYAEHFAAGD